MGEMESPPNDRREQGEWICDKCSCRHSRLSHLKPDNSGNGECRHDECVTFTGGLVGTKCKIFKLKDIYNHATKSFLPYIRDQKDV